MARKKRTGMFLSVSDEERAEIKAEAEAQGRDSYKELVMSLVRASKANREGTS